jgi:hypothetical protein
MVRANFFSRAESRRKISDGVRETMASAAPRRGDVKAISSDMSQPVQHQTLFTGRASAASLNDQMRNELLELYQRSDTLLRELSTVRRRMDELHTAMGGQDATLEALKACVTPQGFDSRSFRAVRPPNAD